MTKRRDAASPIERSEVLVAIVNQVSDFAILQEQGWYRVPIASAPSRWPPRWLAFYQTKVFGEEAFYVRYYGRVREIRRVCRQELFPGEPLNSKSEREYWQIFLDGLERRAEPIISRRLRRIVFIPTTWKKFEAAKEINDLYDDSPLEDHLWTELKRLSIPAERQMDVKVGQYRFMLDFAVYCANGKIDLEADGDTWHADRERIPQDNARNNALESNGWHVLRFNGQQIRETMTEYCVPQVVQMVNRLGGLADDVSTPPALSVTPNGITQQLRLFDGSATYDKDEI